jgi:Asp-tRNA(Asn)/Glu-tRNA(Gln) amidotransferase C subunit
MENPSGSTDARTDAIDGAASNLSAEHVRVIASAVQLDLPPERVDALARSLSSFLHGFAAIRALDTGNREPDTLTHSEEANA